MRPTTPPLNTGPILDIVLSKLDREPPPPQKHGEPRRRKTSEPCLPARLPSAAFLQRETREAISRKEKELTTPEVVQVESPTLQSPTAEEPEAEEPRQRRNSTVSLKSLFSTVQKAAARLSAQGGKTSVGNRPEPWQVREAIDRRDAMILMEIRDKAFRLLLENSGGDTPLRYAIRTDKDDMAIVLLGAFSRYINHLEDEDMGNDDVKTNLKLIRINLKIAIDENLAKCQTNLTASFMQTLVMSEGDKWVRDQTMNVARELRTRPGGSDSGGKPVEVAGAVVWGFATQKLVKADLIASLEDYIGNATADLLILAAWSLALEKITAEHIPTYYFARDDRTYKAFTDLLHKHSPEIKSKLDARLRGQLYTLRDVLEGRAVSYRRKVQMLAEKLDSS